MNAKSKKSLATADGLLLQQRHGRPHLTKRTDSTDWFLVSSADNRRGKRSRVVGRSKTKGEKIYVAISRVARDNLRKSRESFCFVLRNVVVCDLKGMKRGRDIVSKKRSIICVVVRCDLLFVLLPILRSWTASDLKCVAIIDREGHVLSRGNGASTRTCRQTTRGKFLLTHFINVPSNPRFKVEKFSATPLYSITLQFFFRVNERDGWLNSVIRFPAHKMRFLWEKYNKKKTERRWGP